MSEEKKTVLQNHTEDRKVKVILDLVKQALDGFQKQGLKTTAVLYWFWYWSPLGTIFIYPIKINMELVWKFIQIYSREEASEYLADYELCVKRVKLQLKNDLADTGQENNARSDHNAEYCWNCWTLLGLVIIHNRKP